MRVERGRMRQRCPLSGIKRTWASALQMSAFDPKRTFTSFAELSFNVNRTMHSGFVMPRDEAGIFECSAAAKRP